MGIRHLTAAVLAFSFAVSSQSATAEELTVATFVPPQHHTNTVLFQWFGEEIERRSGGSMTMQLFPVGQLGAGPVQQYKRAVEGVADITFGVSAYTPALFPKTMLGILPGAANSSAEATERLEDQDTGGETIAVETEIVEKIYEAAKQKAKGSP